MKNYTFRRFFVALVIALLPVTFFAADFEVDGIAYYITSSTEPYTVAVTSKTNGKYYGDVIVPPTVKYGNVVYDVTTIGRMAFNKCTGLRSIEIPNSVTSINDNSFYGCTGLKSISIPNSVTSIGQEAFSGCTGLISVEIPNSVTSIRSYAFSGCTGLTSIEIPNSVTNIGYNAFSDCTGLTSMEIPNSVTSINDQAFSGCTGLTSIEIPNSVTNIGYNAFSDCTGLTSMEIPNSVTSINDQAFSGCTGLMFVSIPSSITSIGQKVFYGCNNLKFVKWDTNKSGKVPGNVFKDCPLSEFEYGENITTIPSSSLYGFNSLTAIKIPNSLTSINKNAFNSCNSIKYVKWNSNKCAGEIKNLFKDCSLLEIEFGSDVIIIPNECLSGISSLKSVIMNGGVTSIGDRAFSGCTSLTSIEIPNSVTSIGNYVFSGCTGLTSIYIPNGITSIGNYVFYGCKGLTSIEVPDGVASIGSYAFYDCKGLTSIKIPGGVTSIGSYAFYCCIGLTSIKIPSGVMSIGDYVFYGCKSLTSIEVPNGVTSIGSYTFYYCTGLTNMEIPNSVTSIGDFAFDGCSKLSSIKLSDDVKSIGKSAFRGCTSLSSIEIPNSVTEILDGAFEKCGISTISLSSSLKSIKKNTFLGCSGIVSIKIPNGVTSIDDYAFKSCFRLESVDIPSSVSFISQTAFENTAWYNNQPDGVLYMNDMAYKYKGVMPENTSIKLKDGTVSIGAAAFSGCSGLTSVEMPNSVTSIGNYAFKGCTGLASIVIPNSVTSIGNDAFSGCSGLTSVEMPNSVTSIGNYAFKGCTGLDSIVIPNSVTSIGSCAFNDCTGLTSIYIPNGVTSIGGCAFKGCTGLTSITVGDGNTIYDSREGCNAIIGTSTNSLIVGCQTTFIPNSVTSIGDYAFYGCKGLTSIEVPNGVTSIGNEAFNGCVGLTTLEIPSSVTSIISNAISGPQVVKWNASNVGDYSYSSPARIYTKSIVFGPSVSHVPAYLFYNNTSLTSIEISSSVTSIGTDAFYGCYYLTSVVWNANQMNCKLVEHIPSYNYPLKVTFGDEINSIPSMFCYGSKVASVEISSSVTSVASDAFKGCTDLKEIVAHTGMQIFEEGALNGCSGINLVFAEDVTNIEGNSCKNIEEISSVYIPHTVSKVGGYAFSNCKGLKNITCMSVTPPSARFDVCSANEYENVILYVPCSSVEAYENDEHWGKFVQIRCVEAETVSGTVTTTTVTPSYNSASITWPAVPSASSYNISITINGNEYCTMVFNSNGQLVSVDFNEMSGSRSGQLRAAAQVGGYKFNVSGLAEGTEYGYVVVAQNSAGGEISRNTGTFRTLGIVEVEETLESDAKTLQDKVSVSGKLISLNDEKYSDMKIYNTVGQQVGNPVPASGVYIVTAGDDKIKVLVR